jgi:hypothetical protein
VSAPRAERIFARRRVPAGETLARLRLTILDDAERIFRAEICRARRFSRIDGLSASLSK